MLTLVNQPVREFPHAHAHLRPADPKPKPRGSPQKKGRAARTRALPVQSLSPVQPYDALLVLDVEATCVEGSGFDYPNEIIEWPVCLMRWTDMSPDGHATQLEVVDEFRSFVRPTWRPKLSAFCTNLTGIEQDEVDAAPEFIEVMDAFAKFLAKNGLIHPETGERLLRFCWCSDTPCDIRDFVVKQCFISNIQLPQWLHGDILDVRQAVGVWTATAPHAPQGWKSRPKLGAKRPSMNITLQLAVLGLPSFQGRQHSGIDDTRNIARIVTELGRRGVRLEANHIIYPGRRWAWMGAPGEVLEAHIA